MKTKIAPYIRICENPLCKKEVPMRKHSGGSPKRFCTIACKNSHYHKSYRRKKREPRACRKRLNANLRKKKLADQNRCCDLCKQPFKDGETPSLDHDHLTNKNRGLLHNNCNTGIGLLKDSPEICRLAAEYIEKWSKNL